MHEQIQFACQGCGWRMSGWVDVTQETLLYCPNCGRSTLVSPSPIFYFLRWLWRVARKFGWVAALVIPALAYLAFPALFLFVELFYLLVGLFYLLVGLREMFALARAWYVRAAIRRGYKKFRKKL